VRGFAIGWLVFAGCGADLLNNAAIHAHVDDQLQHDPVDARPADRFTLTAGALVPIYGSYELDHRVYGSVRPSAIVLDWILGGIVPAAMVATSFAVGDEPTRSWLRWSALGLYGATRVGVMIVGNLHINEYDDYLARQRAATGSPRLLALSWTW
jgi:hypothetical protein